MMYPFFNKALWASMVYVRSLEDLNKHLDISQLSLNEDSLLSAQSKIIEKGLGKETPQNSKEEQTSQTHDGPSLPPQPGNKHGDADGSVTEAEPETNPLGSP